MNDTWTQQKIARVIDDTEVKPDATRERMVEFCETAAEYGFGSVCIMPVWTELAADILRGTSTAVSPLVGMFGQTPLTQSVAIRDAIARGAQELDVFIALHALLSEEWDRLRHSLSSVAQAADGRPVKLILETGKLTRDQVVRACELCVETGISCVKTSTGMFSRGATVEDIELMRETVGDRIQVKASGGIRTYEQAVTMLEAGADRIGTSTGVQIVDGAPEG